MKNTFIANADGSKHGFLEGECTLKGLAEGLQARICTCDESTQHISEIADWDDIEAIKQARKARYQEELSEEDQIDALWKAIEALEAGNPIPVDAAAVLAKRAQIKAELPYQ